jgi:predicted PurR-regulated permease PerM
MPLATLPAMVDAEAMGERTGRMPPWIPRLLATIVLILVGMYTAFHVIGRLRGLIVILLVSLFLSVALEPGVNFLARKGWRRGLATWAMFLSLILSLGLFVGLMVPLIVDQVSRLITRLPDYVERAYGFLERLGIDASAQRLSDAVAGIDSDLGGFATDLAGSVFGVGQRLLGTVFQLLTIGLFTFYMAAEGPKFRRTVCSLLPPGRQSEVLRAWEIAIDKTGGYFYSRALLALVSAGVGWLVFGIAGIPFALALALWMGILSQFVPVVGTYLGGALPLLIALLESPSKALVVVIYIVVYQQVENYVLAPRITAKTMALHPAVAFGSAIAGGTLLGVPGALMALPAAATIQAFVSTYLERHEVIDSHLTEDAPRRERSRAAPEEPPPG